MDAERITSHEQQAVHSLSRDVAANLAAAHAVEVHRRAKPQPLVLFIVVERQPIDETLVLTHTEKARLPVVAEIVAREREAARAAREDRDGIATNPGVQNAHVTPTFHANRDAAREIGIGIGGESFE